MTPEKKLERKREWARDWARRKRATWTPEELERHREHMRNYKLTPEQKKRKSEYMRERNATPEQKELRHKRNRSPEGRERKRAHSLKSTFNINSEEWNLMFEEQGRCCKICKRTDTGTKRNWHTDHCHLTKKVRGVLCHWCNLMIGNAKDDPECLRAGAEYLLRHIER